ncbi:uncharacterized protein JCM15063_004064 [Sporobolomyces koalae]|uniref:uncharacterized protein n=1 Tax=Sporobolomyces koalae TaxID=500713 RepID=UPI00316C169F
MPPRARASTTTSNGPPDLAIDRSGSIASGSTSGDINTAPTTSVHADGDSVSAPQAPSPSASSKPAKKKSQRPSWSCTECTRRKIRCDRVVPGCNQCIKRGKVHLCRLEQDVDLGFGGPPPIVAPGSPAATASPTQPRLATTSEFDAITRSVNVVRQRLCHLERVMRSFVPQTGLYDEDGQPLFGIDMNLLAAKTGMSREQSIVAEGPASAGLSGPSSQEGYNFDGRAEEYEPRSAYRIEAIAPAQYPLPPTQVNLSKVKEAAERERRMAESDGEVEAAVTLEYLALGRDRKEDHFHRAELRRPEEDDPEAASPPALARRQSPTTDLSVVTENDVASNANSPTRGNSSHTGVSSASLPPPNLSHFIVNYSLDRVSWQHCAVHIGQFRAEHSEFLGWGDKRGELVNQAWLALYFSLLCVGVKHMSQAEAQEAGISTEDRTKLPRVYFDASMAALHRANFLSKHSIYTVQTIVVMIISCQEVGGSDLIATLLASGIRIAQHLNIHRFASDKQWESRRRANGIDPKSQEGIKGLIQRELRKRLWYMLTIEDWLSIPFRRAYSVFPTHFTTPLPVNCHDTDLSAGHLMHRPLSEPTIASKILVTFELAACIRRYYEHVYSSTSPGETSYELCLEVDRQIRKIIEESPPYLKAEDPNSEDWIKHLRHYFVISVSHKLLTCHRVFLGRSFRDPRYAYSRRSAIEAARSVIQEIARGSETHYQHLWTLPFHTIAASTTIILDIFQSSSADPDIPNKRREVELALEQLRKLSDEGSQIATRGVQLLSTLLAEEAKHRRVALPSSASRKRKASGPSDAGRFGDVAKRVVSLNGSPSAPVQGSPQFASSTFPYFAPTLPSTSNGGIAFDNQSPSESHHSDGLNQDAFDRILQGLNGYAGDDSSIGVGGAGAVGVGGAGDAATAEFWRNFDSTFESGAFGMLDGFPDTGLGFDQVGGERIGTPLGHADGSNGGGMNSALGFTTLATPW